MVVALVRCGQNRLRGSASKVRRGWVTLEYPRVRFSALRAVLCAAVVADTISRMHAPNEAFTVNTLI